MANTGEISGAVSGGSADAMRRTAGLERATHERRRQALNLQRENILSQRTSNPGRRAALEAALAQVEARIQALE